MNVDIHRRSSGRNVVRVGDLAFGGHDPLFIAGPCSVESKTQIDAIAAHVKKAGAQVLRGGAFKPRSSPYSFQGLNEPGLKLLSAAAQREGLACISEIVDKGDIPLFERHVDIIQVGARNMQNYDLLKALGKAKKPVLLKRGFANTVDEWLLSAEYVIAGGNENVILCERGIRTFASTSRFTLDIASVPIVKTKSPLPVIVDPSHAAGRYDLVRPLSMAALAAGADGLIVEVHTDPASAESDGAQSLKPEKFAALMRDLKTLRRCIEGL